MFRSPFSRTSNSRYSLLAASDFFYCLRVRNYASDGEKLPDVPRPTRSGLQASYPRGTGGRLSFSGNVCTVFGASGYLGRYDLPCLCCACLYLVAAACMKPKDGTQIIVPYRSDPYDVRHLKTIGDLGQILFFVRPFYLNDEESIRKVVRYSNVVVNLIGSDYPT
uniref:Uncharacterized protein n=1 Tax=Romanomermis culicivorax TaxID=13658 RepID=A0A915JQ10_ROMCU